MKLLGLFFLFLMMVACGRDASTLSLYNNDDTSVLSIGNIADQVIDENSNTTVFTITIENSVLSCEDSLSGVSSNTTLLPYENIVISGTAPDCRVTLSSVVDESGSTTVILSVTDGSKIVSNSFILTVNAPSLISAEWTWVTGATTIDSSGVTGTVGVSDPDNSPRSMKHSNGWTDSNGDFWLYGGRYYTVTVSCSSKLWKFDGTGWAYIASSGRARAASANWIDSDDNFWLFGGLGGSNGADLYNDLLKYNKATNVWELIAGSTLNKQRGTYGTIGLADPTNTPGARSKAAYWTDSSGNFWLFGGYGVSANGSIGLLSDIWKFDGTNWTWVAGSNLVSGAVSYGTKGVADSSNTPGGRYEAAFTVDSNGDLWLYGGVSAHAMLSVVRRDDLWKFDGTNWTWVSGTNLASQSPVYGEKGVFDSSNRPGSRSSASIWVDNSDNLWLYGGNKSYFAGSGFYYNDYWSFNGDDWTWVSGSNLTNQSPVYGVKGIAEVDNIPAGKDGSLAWVDNNGDFWLFGGGYNLYRSLYNDLWKIENL